VEISRVIIDRGHGLNNARPGAFDPGAVGTDESEASLASLIAGNVQHAFYKRLPVVITPELSLRGVVDFVNRIYRPGDLFLVLHLNSANSAAATGVECIYAHNAPAIRATQALYLANTFASLAGLVSRGAKADILTPKGEQRASGQGLPVLRDSRPPAFLLEAGFISNQENVQILREKGGPALAETLQKFIAKEGIR
jgi:N-acetylmuramoyl-L-alanine amidase